MSWFEEQIKLRKKRDDRELADAIAEKAEMAIVYSGADDAGYSICIISKSVDTRELGKAVNQALNGRGGGKPNFLQGSVKTTVTEIKKFFCLFPLS